MLLVKMCYHFLGDDVISFVLYSMEFRLLKVLFYKLFDINRYFS